MAISAGYNSGLLQSVVAKEGIIIRFKNYCNVYLQKRHMAAPESDFSKIGSFFSWEKYPE